jgi:outer membrane protein assembly factor BamB
MERAISTIHSSLLVLNIMLGASCAACASDWPQILGPHRNGVSEEQLPSKFPKAGLKVKWAAAVGQGYAGPAVVGERVLLFHRSAGKERLEAFDVASGRSLWTANFPANYRGGVDPDLGPRCVPLVEGDKVYLYGAAGDCHCVELSGGRHLWSRSLAADYDAPDGYFGAGSSPILLAKTLLLNVGGKEAGLVGLQATTGETKWTATQEGASYSSPGTMLLDGKPQALFVTRLSVVAVDPLSGTTNKLFPFGRTGPTVNAAMPLVVDNKLFVTASYSTGAVLAQLEGNNAKQLWANDDSLSSQYSTPVHRQGYLYGIHGREDIPPAHLRCVELNSGKVMWSQDDFGVAHVIAAGDKLLLLTVGGEIVLAEASPKAYRELGRSRIAAGTTRALPALANGHLYCRTGDKLLCVQLSE